MSHPEFEFQCDDPDCYCHDEYNLKHELNNARQREAYLIKIIGDAHNYVTDPILRAKMRKIAPLPPRILEDM